MSYVAIARKWRPWSFDAIAGQGHVTRTLSNAIRLGRIHHAFLFTGPRGVGKTTAARNLARCLNCERDGPRPDPCGECDSCVAIQAGNSPDVIEIDGASNNSVDDVRELRESVRYLPQRSRTKVYIVDEVHMLSRGAFNALLKTLEEPPAHVVFIFATTEPQKIPDTILSRVQRFDFKRIPEQVVADYLANICQAEGVSVPADGLRLIARAGEGSMRDSQSLLDQVIAFGGDTVTTEQVAELLGLVDRKLLYEMLEGIIRGEADRCLTAIDQVYGYGYDLSEFTSEMLELLRNATLVVLSPSSRRWLDVPDDEVDRLGALAKDVAPEVFVRSFEVMLDVHEQVARAPRPRLVLEMAVARLVMIRPARPLDQVIGRLGVLERRLRQGGVQPRQRDVRPGRGRGGPAAGRDDDDPDPGPPALTPRSSAPPTGSSGPRNQAGAGLATVAEPAPLPPSRPPQLRELPPPPQQPDRIADRGPEPATEALQQPLPQPPAGASAEVRFHLLREWLRREGLDFEGFAMDAVLLAVRPPELLVGFRTPFQLKQAQRKVAHPRLKAGMGACFPGCTAVQASLVDDDRGSSQREADQAAYEQRVRDLEAELRSSPLASKLQNLLGASLVSVTPDAQVRAVPAELAELPDGADADDEEDA